MTLLAYAGLAAYKTMPSFDKLPGETLNFTGLPGSSPMSVPVEQDFPLICNSSFFCRRPIQMTLPEAGAAGRDAARCGAGVTSGFTGAACAGTPAVSGCLAGGAAFSTGGGLNLSTVAGMDPGALCAISGGGARSGA